jgi:hypothetical protein
MQQTDMLQCETLVVVCRTVIKEQQNISVLQAIFLSKQSSHTLNIFPVTDAFLDAL